MKIGKGSILTCINNVVYFFESKEFFFAINKQV